MKRDVFKSRSVGKHLTAATDNVIYTCPPNYTAHVVLLFVSNLGNSNKTVSAKWYNSHDNATYSIIGGYVISAYNYLKLDGSYLTLNAGDYISVNPEVASTMDATVTVEEFYDPASQQ